VFSDNHLDTCLTAESEATTAWYNRAGVVF